MLDEKLLGAVLNGKYRLTRVLGQGGMGMVFEGENVRVGRRVAVKVLMPELSANKEMLRRFEREARAAAEIGNPHIVEIADYDATPDDLHFIVMEFLQGEPLSSLLEREGRLSVARALDLAVQSLEGLSAAHAAGIVHRDIKPDNIFVCPKVEERRSAAGVSMQTVSEYVKLVDFGISRFQRHGEQETKLTATGTILGTPYYMAPEQVGTSKSIDHRADVYSMGTVLYHMLAGTRPYQRSEEDGMVEVLYRVKYEEAEPLGARCPDLPPQVVHIVEKAMAKAPDDRFQDAEALIEALCRWREFPEEGLPAGVERSSRRGAGGRPAAATPTARGAAATTGTRSEAIGAFTVPGAGGGGAWKKVVAATLVLVLLAGGGVAAWLLLGKGRGDAPVDAPAKKAQPAPAPQPAAQPETPPAPVEAKPEEAAPPAPAPAVEPPEGPVVLLKLDTTPQGASVVLDGLTVGKTPIELPAEADGKSHEIRFLLDGYRPELKNVVFSKLRKEIGLAPKLKKIGAKGGGAKTGTGGGEIARDIDLGT